MNKLPWFRLYGEIIDDEKLLLLAFEDRWHYIAMLACKSRGLLDKDEDPDLTLRKLALKLGLARRELDEVARRLSEVGLVDRATLQPTGWDERQFRSDSSTDRVAKYRERMMSKRACNVSETAQDTEQKQNPSETTSPQSSRPVATTRGNRLPQDWMPDEAMLGAAVDRGLTGQALRDEVDKFRNYWHSKPGKDGLKLDWGKTFSNWIITATKNHGAPHGTHDPRSSRPSLVERVAANARRIIAAERAAIGLDDGDPVAADGADLRAPLDGTARRIP